MTATTDSEPAGHGHTYGFGTKPYRTYVLLALTFIYILNFIDRGLLSVVAPAMKPELGISDTAFGLLTGFGFAALYTTVGLPLAQFAETRHRVWIMTVCIALWSLMTALCGLATEITIGSMVIGAFWVLLACRIGVGIGEAGCTPPANSLIADYYPPKRRSTALGVYAMGVTLGTVAANLIGGPVTDAFGWRWAFFVLGLPGIAVAIVLKLTVKEPPRGYTDPPGTVRQAKADFGFGMKMLFSKKSYWAMIAGCTMASFCGYGIATFQSLFINRSFGLTAGQAALQINVPVYVASALGTVVTGWLAERWAAKHPNAIAWIPGFGLILSVPFYWLAFTTDNLQVCLFGLVVGGFVKYGYLAAQYTIGQGVVTAQVRAVATAVLLFVQNMVGYGLGPLFIGAVSDIIFRMKVTDLGMTELVRKSCEGAAKAKLTADQLAVCQVANPESLQQSMLITGTLYALAGAGLLLACRWLRGDMVAKS
jgi:predicted MFS family arabinose efflux permease